MKHFCVKNTGFSILSVIVAAGLLGGLALMIAQLAKQQHQVQKKAETGTEVVALSRRILHTLYDGNACIQTLGSGTAIRPGTPLSVNAIKNKSGRDLIVTGGTYGNRLLKVSSIKVVNPVVNGDTAEAKLESGDGAAQWRLHRAEAPHQELRSDLESGHLRILSDTGGVCDWRGRVDRHVQCLGGDLGKWQVHPGTGAECR